MLRPLEGNPMSNLLRIQIHLLTLAADAARRLVARRGDDGQATAEYALVLVAAVAIAGLAVTWARRTNVLDTVLDNVFNSLLQQG